MYGSTESPPAPPRLKKLTKALTLPLATAHDPPTSSQSHKKLLLIVFVGLILYNNTSPPINLPELAGSFPAAPNAWSTLPPSTASTKSSRLTPLQSVKRPASSSPSESLFLPDALSTPLPTNRWYQSLMLGMNDDAPLTKNQKAYVQERTRKSECARAKRLCAAKETSEPCRQPEQSERACRQP